jgi:hypothetical protein
MDDGFSYTGSGTNTTDPWFPVLDVDFWDRRVQRAVDAAAAAIDVEEAARGNRRRDLVCMYWLRGRCNAGPRCRFLHKYIPDKVELCQYIGTKCENGPDCVFRHYYLDNEMPVTHVHDPIRLSAKPGPFMAARNHPSTKTTGSDAGVI